MKKISSNHKIQSIKKRKAFPTSGIVLLVLLLSTFLTVLVAEQQQESRSKAADTPIQQACLPATNLTPQEAGKIEPFCTSAPDATICKDFCKRTEANGAASTSPLCKAGGIYACEGAAGATEKGKCQAGTCASSPRTGTDTYCGGGQTCCAPPQPEGGTCASDPGCMTGLKCEGNKCTKPAPVVQPGGKPGDADGDGIPDGVDPDPIKKNADGMGTDGKKYAAPIVPPANNGAAPDGGGKKYPVNSNAACQPNATAPAIKCATANGYSCKNGFCMKTPVVPAKKYPVNDNAACQPNATAPAIRCAIENGYSCKNGFCVKTPIVNTGDNAACRPNATAPAIRCATESGYSCKNGFCVK